MLKFSTGTRMAVQRRTRLPSCAKGRGAMLCRASEGDAGTTTSTFERPLIDEDAKVKATISALDSLLGSQDKVASATTSPRSPSSSSSSSSGASTSSTTAPSAPKTGFKVPPLPLGGSGSSSSTPRRKPAGLTFDQVMGFSGLAPEVINGRAAMIGFLLAINNELRTGESIFAQMVSGGAGQALLVIFAVTVASFAPAIRGVPLDEVFNKAPKAKVLQEWGPFTAAAEGLNGRLAMLGIALLLFFEGAGSTAFFLN